eukprot:11040191-Alexandrium_andersonii.AAC.1
MATECVEASAGSRPPEFRRLVVGGSQELGPIRREGPGVDVAAVAPKCQEAIARGRAPEPGRPVPGSGEDPRPVGGEDPGTDPSG